MKTYIKVFLLFLIVFIFSEFGVKDLKKYLGIINLVTNENSFFSDGGDY